MFLQDMHEEQLIGHYDAHIHVPLQTFCTPSMKAVHSGCLLKNNFTLDLIAVHVANEFYEYMHTLN